MRFCYVLLGLAAFATLQTSSGACSNGIRGVQHGDVCCEAKCRTCGGDGCDLRRGGADSCCYGAIASTGVMCSTTERAPCIIDQTCSNGIPGVEHADVCCEAQCGTCGGDGCHLRPGGAGSCCYGDIASSGVMCSTTSAAPCVMY